MRKDLWILTIAVVCGALSACSTESPDPHGHADAAEERQDVTADATPPLDRAAEDAPTDGARDAGGAMCSPPCGADQVCCTDQHGHFPTCRAGTACPDAGGP